MNRRDARDPAVLLASAFASRVTAWSRQQMQREGRAFDQVQERLLLRAVYRVSKATGEGHVCVTLDEILQRENTALHEAAVGPGEDEAAFLEELDAIPEEAFSVAGSFFENELSNDHGGGDNLGDIGNIGTSTLRALLLDAGVVGTPQNPGAMPLILDEGDRLYLHKYFDFEKRLAVRLQLPGALRQSPAPAVRERLHQLFRDNRSGEGPDWQLLGAALALIRPVTIISGGPGTGKTTTVANLLACLLTENPQYRIALTAPTGKAAARMLQALRARAAHLPEDLRALLPDSSGTVHRLMGVTPGSGEFRHNARNPLAIDILVVDEASMLDLALAVRLFEAVPPHARIILLGDKDQLAAVEAGAVFSELSANPSLSDATRAALADITGITLAPQSPTPLSTAAAEGTTPAPGLRDAVVWFTHTHRFSRESAVGQLASRIVSGDAPGTLQWLQAQSGSEAQWLPQQDERLSATATETILAGFLPYLHTLQTPAPDSHTVFEAFDRFRVLCAIRSTERGVDALNRMISTRMRALLPKTEAPTSPWYVGRPVLVTRNDYTMRLFNGDIGIALLDDSGQLMVYFSDQAGTFRAIAPSRLPAHETAFAMTVHKAQGSEFERVMVILPAEDSRVATRELLYTAVTRASSSVVIAASENAVLNAVATPTRRVSGLQARLRE